MAGVSRHFSEPLNLPEYYEQCISALRIGKKLGRPDTFFHYDNLSVYNLFERLRPNDLALCCHCKVRALEAYDKRNKTELCITLQVYLENLRSLSLTAKILFVHRNTVRYRIERCMSLLGIRLDTSSETFTIMLSLRILEYEKKFLNEF